MRPKIGLITAVLVSVVSLWIVDIFLARIERAEVQSEARRNAQQGVRLLTAGHPVEAIEALRKAHSLERDSTEYALELSDALITAGRIEEAGTILADALERSPNAGRANLLEARLMVRQGKLEDAEAYYHRAIYGMWTQNSQAQRIRVRLELANLLASKKSNEELVAELIPLDVEAQPDLNVRRQVAHLYIEAGAVNRALTAYRALIRDDPGDGHNYAGLGEADLALGNYRDAQSAFADAIKHGDDVRARLDLAIRLVNLDPTPRFLSAATKFARSTEILKLARDALARCAITPAAQKSLDEADAMLSAKGRGPMTNEMAEDRLAMAQTLAEFRGATCPGAPDDEALSLIMRKLSE